MVDSALANHLEESGIIYPPTEDELPYDDGMPMESQRHSLQMHLLIDTLQLHWQDRPDGYVGGNQCIYFNLDQLRDRDFRGPDFFAVLDVPVRERKSWVVWQEGKGPDVVIELLSKSTAARDEGEKKIIYQDSLRVPEYYWFDPFNSEWAGFTLHCGVYVPIEEDEQGHFRSHQLQLMLVRWQGVYHDIEATWLRWANLEGDLLPTPQEAAEACQREAEAAKNEAEAAKQNAVEMEALLAQYRQRFGELPAE